MRGRRSDYTGRPVRRRVRQRGAWHDRRALARAFVSAVGGDREGLVTVLLLSPPVFFFLFFPLLLFSSLSFFSKSRPSSLPLSSLFFISLFWASEHVFPPLSLPPSPSSSLVVPLPFFCLRSSTPPAKLPRCRYTLTTTRRPSPSGCPPASASSVSSDRLFCFYLIFRPSTRPPPPPEGVTSPRATTGGL